MNKSVHLSRVLALDLLLPVMQGQILAPRLPPSHVTTEMDIARPAFRHSMCAKSLKAIRPTNKRTEADPLVSPLPRHTMFCFHSIFQSADAQCNGGCFSAVWYGTPPSNATAASQTEVARNRDCLALSSQAAYVWFFLPAFQNKKAIIPFN